MVRFLQSYVGTAAADHSLSDTFMKKQVANYHCLVPPPLEFLEHRTIQLYIQFAWVRHSFYHHNASFRMSPVTYQTGKWSKKKNLRMYLPKTNLYIPSDSWDAEVESWATTLLAKFQSMPAVPEPPVVHWERILHFMATYNWCSVMGASSATALQQECHRQSEGRTPVPPSVPPALLRVSQILLLSSPCNLPKQHILQTLRNRPTS